MSAHAWMQGLVLVLAPTVASLKVPYQENLPSFLQVSNTIRSHDIMSTTIDKKFNFRGAQGQQWTHLVMDVKYMTVFR